MSDLSHRIRHTLAHLSVSVHSQYGAGAIGYGKFIYYTCLRRNRFVVYSMRPGDRPAPASIGDDFRFRAMTPEELEPYRRQPGLPKEFFADAMTGAVSCHTVFRGEALAYIHWVYRAGQTTRFLRLAPGVAEIGYIVTLPDYRRSGVCAWALSEAFARLEAEGVKRVVTVVHSENTASCRAMERVGMRRDFEVCAIGPFNGRVTIEAV